jgi:tRNA-2-methylthio-N6-dimethylallyladenosine synthase
VDETVKAERLARLQALLEAQQRAFNASQVGRDLPVLFEKPGRHPGQIIGRSPFLQAVHCDGPLDRIGAVETTRIIGSAHNSLTGRRTTAVTLERA